MGRGRQAGLWLGGASGVPDFPEFPHVSFKETRHYIGSPSVAPLSTLQEDTPAVFLLPLYVWTKHSWQQRAEQFHTCGTSPPGSKTHISCYQGMHTLHSPLPQPCLGAAATEVLRDQVLSHTAYLPCSYSTSPADLDGALLP